MAGDEGGQPNRWAPQQGPVMARSAMVAGSHPAATQAGIDVLRAGGNAVDAATAVAFLLTVLKPTRSQIGGDVFWLVYSAQTGEVTAINGSGIAPAGATLAAYVDGIPERGIRSVAVPGFVDGVLAAHERFGSRPRAELLAPAIAAAEDGFPVSLRLAQQTAEFAPILRRFPATTAAFMPNGRLPRPGQILRQPDLARTLRQIAEGGSAAFYSGPFVEALLRVSREQGGYFSPDDLPAHRTEIGAPIACEYRGLTVYEQPPVTQGHILLEELLLLEGFDLAGRSPVEPDVIHLMVEAKKLAFADRMAHAGDPNRSRFDVRRLLDADFIAERRARIDPRRAADEPAEGRLAEAIHDTTSFAVCDAGGNAVAAIQSVFHPWGSGLVVEGTGVLLNDRMCSFTLEPGHPNALEPGKRPVHTLNNYLITRDGRPYLFGGTPGGMQQVQTNMQIISAVVDGGYDVQTAVDLPRWGHNTGPDLTLESRYDEGVSAELERRGHRVRRTGAWDGLMGRVMAIQIDTESGARLGASDLRGEGSVAGF
ncbi:MAG TPA: gamma-glutamyltransferase [Dehalococcoidia bacterium]|nr:gamma-glutamyltransferase [Dehalococcoidia bacterium]